MPDENVSFNLTAIPAAIRIVRQEGIDVVITTSPPGSIHLVGAAVKRATGVRWIADLRDSLVAHPHRDSSRVVVRAKEQGQHAVASRRRPHRRRDRGRLRRDRRGGSLPLASRPGRDDPERLRLRRLRGSRLPARATGSGSRMPARSSASATRARFSPHSRASTASPRASSATSGRATGNGQTASWTGSS